MEDGLYHLRANSSRATVEGVVVVSANRVNGGGPDYCYQGHIFDESGELTGTLVIKKWNDPAPPSLGMFKEAAFRVSGEYDSGTKSFHLNGQANGHHVIKVELTGRFIAPVV